MDEELSHHQMHANPDSQLLAHRHDLSILRRLSQHELITSHTSEADTKPHPESVNIDVENLRFATSSSLTRDLAQMGQPKKFGRRIKIEASIRASKIFGHRSSSKEFDWEAIRAFQQSLWNKPANQQRNGNPDLCDVCAGIPFGKLPLGGYRLHNNVKSLVFSAASCPLCRLVRYQLSGIVGQRLDAYFFGVGDHNFNITLDTNAKDWRMWLSVCTLYMGELEWFAASGKSIPSQIGRLNFQLTGPQKLRIRS